MASKEIIQRDQIFRRLGLVPIFLLPILLFLFETESGFLSGAIFNPPFFYAILNTIILAPVGVAVAYFSTRAFLATGSLNLLFLGRGVLTVSIMSLATWLGVSTNEINSYYTIWILAGIFFGSLIELSGAVMTIKGVTIEKQAMRHALSIVSYLLIAALAGTVIFTTVLNYLPPFFIVGQGQTFLSHLFLALSIAPFAFSSLILAQMYRKSKSEILCWYSLGLGLTASSILVYLFIPEPGSAISWLFRIASFATSIYFLKAVLSGRAAQKEETVIVLKEVEK